MDVPQVLLSDGSEMTEEQQALYGELWRLVEATRASGKPQVPSKKHAAELESAAAVLAADTDESRGIKAWLTPICVRRYLVANQFQPKQAYEALFRTIAWRCQHVPVTPQPLSDFSACVKTRYMEWMSHDSVGRPNLLIKSRNADLEISREDRAKYLIFAMEQGVRFMRQPLSPCPGVERWNMIIDETGKEWKHMDNGFLHEVTPVVFSNYVEHLNRCYVINPGTLTNMAIAVVKLFLDERTKAKMCVIHAKKPKDGSPMVVQTLLDDLGPENVPVSYGGTRPDENLEEYCARMKNV